LLRQKQLTSDNATSESTLQKAQTTRDQALAKRDMSRINLAYTEIRAPFAGRIGARAFDVGNLVGASDSTKLATLDRIQPVYVNFNRFACILCKANRAGDKRECDCQCHQFSTIQHYDPNSNIYFRCSCIGVRLCCTITAQGTSITVVHHVVKAWRACACA